MSDSEAESPLTVDEIVVTISSQDSQRAEKVMLLVPEGWPDQASSPVYAGSTDSVRKLARQHALPVETLDQNSAELLYRENRSADWVAPTLFVSSMLMSENPTAVSVALNVLSNYVTEYFKGMKADPRVELCIIHQNATTKKSTRLRYKGPVSGMKDVETVIRNLHGRK